MRLDTDCLGHWQVDGSPTLALDFECRLVYGEDGLVLEYPSIIASRVLSVLRAQLRPCAAPRG